MNALNSILEEYPDEDFLICDGFDHCVIGLDPDSFKLVYDIDACIETLKTRDGMNEEEAVEYFLYNVSGASMGDNTPLFIHLFIPKN